MLTPFRLPHRRVRLFFDRDKREAEELAEAVRPFVAEPAEAIVVIGGDGTMLRAIRTHWRDGLPFFGLNTGHLGFLLNDPADDGIWDRDLRKYRLPLMDVEVVCPKSRPKAEVAFNDCWVERETGQTAWIEVCVNGVPRMEKPVDTRDVVRMLAGQVGRRPD